MKLYTENFEIEVYAPEDEVYPFEDEGSQYGLFRHNEKGDSYAVGMWFYAGKLMDYEEIGDDIPKEVLDALEAVGFNVDDMRSYQVAA